MENTNKINNEAEMEMEKDPVETVVEVKESKIKGLLKKTGDGFTKHKKKIAVGTLFAVACGVVYALAKGGSNVQEVYLPDTNTTEDLDNLIQTAEELIEDATEVVEF